MAYVTADPRVIELMDDTKGGVITRETFVAAVLGLGFLDWELEEALKVVDGGDE